MEQKYQESKNLLQSLQTKANEFDANFKNFDARFTATENRINPLDSRIANVEINIDFLENQTKKLIERSGPQGSLEVQHGLKTSS